MRLWGTYQDTHILIYVVHKYLVTQQEIQALNNIFEQSRHNDTQLLTLLKVEQRNLREDSVEDRAKVSAGHHSHVGLFTERLAILDPLTPFTSNKGKGKD